MVSRKLAMKDEHKHRVQVLKTSSIFPFFTHEKRDVLSGETGFHRIGPLFRRMGSRASPVRTFVENPTVLFQRNHPVKNP